MTAIGYVSDAPFQTEAVAGRIYSVATIVPAVCYLIVFLILLKAYPLTKNIVEENANILRERHKKEDTDPNP